MSRTALNFLVDCCLLVEFVGLVFVSAVARFVFPPGSQAAGWRLWGGDFEAWAGAQFALLCVLTLTIVLHLMLHWTWVCGVITQRLSRRRGETIRWNDGTRTLIGVGLLISLLGLLGTALAAAVLSVQPPT